MKYWRQRASTCLEIDHPVVLSNAAARIDATAAERVKAGSKNSRNK